jgi:peroxiredoxin
MPLVDVGSPAPDFVLTNHNREPVRLSDEYANRPVVLVFFPAAFSSVCTTELCTMRDGLAAVSPGVGVFGISVDTFFTLKAFHHDLGLTYPLLSDFNKDVIRAYGVFCEEMIGLKGLAKRAVFLIDTTGRVRYREVLEDARNEPDYARLEDAIRRL